jgi:hypothetical protein
MKSTSINLLKMVHIRNKTYTKRGQWSRVNKALYMVLRKYGHEAWVIAARNLSVKK